jgi:hypothetical protein
MPKTWRPPDEQTWAQLLSEVAGVEKIETQIAREYRQTQDEVRLLMWRMKVDDVGNKVTCISDGEIKGCLIAADYPLWLIPWTDLRKDGLPVGQRSDFRYWIPACLNCLILEQSKRRHRKSAWVSRVSKQIRKGTHFVRSIYESEYEDLECMLDPHKVSVREQHFNWRENIPKTIILQIGVPFPNIMMGEVELININTTRVKEEGIVTLTYSE